jgi:hypothetical protein
VFLRDGRSPAGVTCRIDICLARAPRRGFLHESPSFAARTGSCSSTLTRKRASARPPRPANSATASLHLPASGRGPRPVSGANRELRCAVASSPTTLELIIRPRGSFARTLMKRPSWSRKYGLRGDQLATHNRSCSERNQGEAYFVVAAPTSAALFGTLLGPAINPPSGPFPPPSRLPICRQLRTKPPNKGAPLDRSLPRSDGSSTVRFVVDLPANQLGPGWRRKLQAAG